MKGLKIILALGFLLFASRFCSADQFSDLTAKIDYLQGRENLDARIKLESQAIRAWTRPDTLKSLAEIYERTASDLEMVDQPALAIKILNRAWKIEPLDGDINFLRGVAWGQLRRYGRAVSELKWALRKSDPHRGGIVYVYRNLCENYAGLGQYGRALSYCNLVFQSGNVGEDNYVDRGQAYAGLGQYDRALADFNEAARIVNRINPDMRSLSRAYGVKYVSIIEMCEGHIYFLKRNYSQAMSDYNEAIGGSPQYAPAYRRRGELELRLKEYPQALKDLNKAIALDSQFVEAYTLRGDVYSETGQKKAALKNYVDACSKEYRPACRKMKAEKS